MHGSSRDDRQKREQQRQEREMAKFAQMYDISRSAFIFCCGDMQFLADELSLLSLITRAANKKQEEQQTPEEVGNIPAPSMVRTATALADQDQRKTLKFGFSAKGGSSKVFAS